MGLGNGKQSDKLKNSKQTWCLTSTETIKLIRAGEKGGGGGGGREGMWRRGGEYQQQKYVSNSQPLPYTVAQLFHRHTMIKTRQQR